MKKLSNTEAELSKSVAYIKKACDSRWCDVTDFIIIYILFSGAQLRKERGGGAPLPFFENQKKCPDFGKNILIVSMCPSLC